MSIISMIEAARAVVDYSGDSDGLTAAIQQLGKEVERSITIAEESWRLKAQEMYGTDDIEVDDTALASIGDSGVWVSSWLWVPNVGPNAEDDEDDEDEDDEAA